MQQDLFHYCQHVAHHATLTTLENDVLDIAVLTYLGYSVERRPGQCTFSTFPHIVTRATPYNRTHRTVYYTLPQQDDEDCSFVGFISKKRCSIEPTLQTELTSIDSALVSDLVHLPGLLSYSSLELSDGNWCNLVVYRHSDIKKDMQTGHLHQYAARELAPHYYQWIRLHHGVIPAGMIENGLVLHKTKFYAFTTQTNLQERHYQSPTATLCESTL